jgi:hypothetical protein
LVRSEEILEGRAERLTDFLRIELDEIVRAAHVVYVKRDATEPLVSPQRERAKGTVVTLTVPPSEKVQAPEVWRGLHDRFRELSEEELTLARQNLGDRWLRAYVDYKDSAIACGQWHLSDGINENFRECFEVEATRAGIALNSTSTADLRDIWLHHVFSDLLEHDSKLLFAASKEEGGIIVRACEASAVCCVRLEKHALVEGRKGSTAAAVPAQIVESPSTNNGTRGYGLTRSALGKETFIGAAIRKVQNPQTYTVLSTPEAALYFEVKPRTVHRWVEQGKLKNGARRGSITIESIRLLEKKLFTEAPVAVRNLSDSRSSHLFVTFVDIHCH